MDLYLADWLNLLLRWAHVVTAIAWIGSSFYFVFLDSSLTKPTAPDLQAKGVDGELWAVHGGGFYHPQKYLIAPQQLPKNLHWFYWESYSTWLTGFALFTVLYLYNASTFLIDKSVYAWSPAMAITASLSLLLLYWLVYDMISRLFARKPGAELKVGALVALLTAAAAYLACQLFAGRAAFLLVGAMMATAMSANVFVWIIPGQRKVVAQMKASQPVDPVLGQRAKQRSVHNTYFTLPVLIAMLSNHYGFLFQVKHSWAVLVALMAAGALIRHSFVARHKAQVQGKRVPWEYAGAGVLLILCLVYVLSPSKIRGEGQAVTVNFAQIKAIIDQRCVMCHNAQVQQKGVALHEDALIAQHAQAVYQQAVVLKLMPMNNATQISNEERGKIAHWYEQGANMH
jgi:uncharacterized membrane protein